jgi:cation diffusion facilitator family transporter
MANYRERERSIGTSLLVDFVLLLPDIAAAVIANSLTMWADVLKCANELLATFLSWMALRKVRSGKSYYFDYGLGKLENLTSIVVAWLMFLSLIIVLHNAIDRFRDPHEMHAGGVYLGIFLMTIGVCANSWLWIKNYRISRKEHSPIMESQWRLFRAKTVADLSVLLTLALSIFLQRYAWSVYIDPCGSLAIAGFLLFSIYHIIANSVSDLLDRTLDESLQMVIIKDLAAFYDHYKAIHGVHSRRSGSNIYIEIFLEFDGEKKMSEVQEIINRIKSGIEQHIKGSFVTVAPASAPVVRRKVDDLS